MFIPNKCIISGSRTIAPKENCPQNRKPNPNPNRNPNDNRGAIFLEGNCPDTIISDPLYQKDCARNFIFSQVHQINLQRSVISRHRINH